MAAEKTMFVRHVHTGEIKKVTAEQREKQNRNFWVRITGDGLKPTAPEASEPADPKTTSKDTPSK